MSKYKITQVISKNGETRKQKETLLSLGIRRMHQTVEVEKNPVTTGMLNKVRHLVTVEEIN